MRKKKEFHGDTKTDLYQRWASMVNRCKPGRFSKTYFDKGIRVCDEWQIYSNFKIWALSNGFSKELELDRIDNKKGYYPINCRFITKIENNSNRSNTVFINYKGENISLTLFVIKNKLSQRYYNTVRRRIKNGWDHDLAIDTPIRIGNYGNKGSVKVVDKNTGFTFSSVKEAAEYVNIKPNSLSMMLNGHKKNKTSLIKSNQ
ncbi:hypothetical protein MP478_04515 [Chryseobacterium sp. WG14]|uniref:hypothetical protein n=1 Tax=Chryseobacterium sp. WG14 TaxID=2926909 RepID=UPI00211EF8E0|nr:hypothetical protein [Chryseobacterium sp. WG14]MCQ9638643.1 hypothetical protein [Chryseobacterium sp. WG14]